MDDDNVIVTYQYQYFYAINDKLYKVYSIK